MKYDITRTGKKENGKGEWDFSPERSEKITGCNELEVIKQTINAIDFAQKIEITPINP